MTIISSVLTQQFSQTLNKPIITTTVNNQQAMLDSTCRQTSPIYINIQIGQFVHQMINQSSLQHSNSRPIAF